MQSISTSPSWSDLATLYREYLQSAGPSSATVRLRVSQMHRLARELAVEPHEVTTELLLRFMKNDDWAANTRATWRASISGFFKFAHGLGHLPSNPALMLPTVRVPHGQPKPASDDALAHASTRGDMRTALMVELGARAGLRCMEIATLRREHVIAEKVKNKKGKTKTLYSLRITGKGGKTRTVPIAKDFGMKLSSLPDGPIFHGRVNGCLSPAYVSKLLSEVLPDKVTGHKLRHRFATLAYRNSGNDLRAVQELLGHSNIQTTTVYTEVGGATLRRAALSAS